MSHKLNWHGVFPAITTPFHPDLSIDYDFLKKHLTWLIDQGCHGIVALGSLGEGATLEKDEKIAILKTCVETVGKRSARRGRHLVTQHCRCCAASQAGG
ncbi:MAG: dihydrodipicolinate synthase family protein [Gemmatales bacterium]